MFKPAVPGLAVRSLKYAEKHAEKITDIKVPQFMPRSRSGGLFFSKTQTSNLHKSFLPRPIENEEKKWSAIALATKSILHAEENKDFWAEEEKWARALGDQKLKEDDMSNGTTPRKLSLDPGNKQLRPPRLNRQTPTNIQLSIIDFDERRKQAERQGTNPGPGTYSVDSVDNEKHEESQFEVREKMKRNSSIQIRNNNLKASKSDYLGPTATTYFRDNLTDRMRKIYRNTSTMLGQKQIPFNSKVPKLPTYSMIKQYQAVQQDEKKAVVK